MDGRLDRYFSSHTHGILLGRIIAAHAPAQTVSANGKQYPASYMLFYNTATDELVQFDKTVPLIPIVQELERLRTAANAWIAANSRPPS
jgi:hypothetical protein